MILADFASSLGPWLGIIGCVVALLAFVATQIGQSRTLTRAASAELVVALEKELALVSSRLEATEERLDECERDRKSLHGDVARLERREVEYLRRLARIEENGT